MPAQAIRAIRHPERYGPRSGGTLGPDGALAAQSRARGLTRAILDTFPVVKFGQGQGQGAARADETGVRKDVEAGMGAGAGEAVEMRDARRASIAKSEFEEAEGERREGDSDAGNVAEWRAASMVAHAAPSSSPSPSPHRSPSPSPRASTSSSADADLPPAVPRPPKASRAPPTAGERESGGNGDRGVVPDAIGRETCPICIVDFEAGDDLRVLPCEGHHRFHQACVDPWLLELSSSCPICRQGAYFSLFGLEGDAH